MSTQPEGKVFTIGPNEERQEIFGQNVLNVRQVQEFLFSDALSLTGEFGQQVVGSAILSACANYLLSFYTPESVREIYEGLLPNLQAMHDDLMEAYIRNNSAGDA